MLTANAFFVRVLYNLRYQGKGNLSAENNSKCQETNLPLKMYNGRFTMLLYLVHYLVPFDYVSTQELENIVSERLNSEKAYIQFSHELL